MEVVSTQNGDSLVVDVIGQLNTGTASKLESEINKILTEHQKIILNLNQTLFVSSAGLRVFLMTAKKLKASGGNLRFCHANEVVTEILEISGFSTILDVKDSLEDALSGF
jgi:anti-sigma B factor antagonist